MPDWVWNTLYDKGSIEKPEGDVASVEPINRIGERLTEIYTMQEAIRKFAYLEAALGNSVQIKDTVAAVLAEMEIRGEITVRRVVFYGGNTVDMLNGGNWPFSNGASLTFTGLDSAVSANNKTATVTTVSGSRMSFSANTFPASGVSLNGTVTDGTTTIYITVSPDHPQSLDSLSSFEIFASAENLARVHPTKTYPVTLQGVTYAYDGDQYITLNGTSTSNTVNELWSISNGNFAKIKKGQKYSLSIQRDSGTATGYVSFRIREKNIVTGTTIERALNLLSGANSALLTITATDDLLIDRAIITNQEGAGIVFSNAKVRVGMFIGDTAGVNFKLNQGVNVHFDLKNTNGDPVDLGGIPLTYNLDGSANQFQAQDRIVQKISGDSLPNTLTVGKWYHASKYYKGTLTGGLSVNFADLGTVCRANINVAPPKNFTPEVGGEKTRGVSNYLQNYTYYSGDYEHFYTYYSYNGLVNRVHVALNKSRLSEPTLAGMNAYLAANPFYYIAEMGDYVYTELHADNQTALNAIAQSFDGTTNIMLSTSIGQIYAKAAKNITKVIDDIKAAIVLLG